MQVAPFVAVASALLYGAVAIAMNFVNKATLMSFPLSGTILLLQMFMGIVIVKTLAALGLVQLSRNSLRVKKALELLPLCLLYNGNTAAALMGLNRVQVPVYSTVKRLTPMLVLGVKVCVMRKRPHPHVLTSVVLVVAGCVVAGAGDLSFDAAGYTLSFMSSFFQAAYLLVVEHTGAEKGVGSAELLLYNSVLSLPFLLLLVVLTGEVYHIGEAYRDATIQGSLFPLLLLLCSCMGCLLNYSIFLCTINNSALTTTIVGVLKGVLSTLLGFFLLGGVRFSWLNVVGIFMNTLGGCMYTAVKYRQKQAALRKRATGEGEERLLGGANGERQHEHAV
ncbi:sugar phosphate transporter [Chloropicon primus]|uniref:Sugar phosphate transporter n=1 Tax=Chloropicon primus TaxID=1764295 RepID=A0A5B8MX24_9CHLO|nr:sugar phosphate transporter [Chloropicon primus]|eukprot:QDZ24235.1 sugar phosphate transporter [Chloropicon primus]